MKTLCKKIIILIFIFTTLLGTTLPTNVVYAIGYTGDLTPYTPEDNNVSNKDLDSIIQEDTKSEVTVGKDNYTKFKLNEKSTGWYRIYGGELKVLKDGKLQDAPSKYDVYSRRYYYNLDGNTEYYIKTADINKFSYNKYVKEDKKTSFFETVEGMISWFVRTAANGLVKLIDWAVGGGEGVTIDKIIFNQYKPTKLVYFSPEKDALKEGATDPNVNSNYEYPIVHLMSKAITEWFNIFRAVAITGYTSILLYIGIQILLKATAEKQAEYKRLLTDWVVGVVILFLFPTVIKTAIEMNNSLVESIGKSRGILDSDGNVSYQNTTHKQANYTALNPNMSEQELKAYASTFDGNPFSDDNKDYMAIMAKKADKTKRLSYAVVYMIMAWQLLMLIIIYYKRLFMVGFLLVFFPLVALTYALDKVKDGKSQAFNTWGKEILLNIFIQTFHAIIYVFALGVTFEASEVANDWILMIIGVSFLFKGEEIIKKIFGYKSSDTVDSLVSTATKT